MNELALLNEMRSSNPELTMSSIEIAQLTGSRHDHVRTSIERLVAKTTIPQPSTREDLNYEQDTNIAHKSKTYLLDKRSSIIVVAQLCPQFTARIVDRWQVLENRAQAGLLGLPDFTSPADAARAWANQYDARERAEFQAAELATENAKLLPRAKIADDITNADGTNSMAEAAKILGTGRNKLFKRLRSVQIITGTLPYQRFIDRGYFQVKETVVNIKDVKKLIPQTFVTGKGITWLAKNIKK